MGDRGNIVVRASQSSRDDVWFYGHWSGYRLEDTVQVALAKKWRWGDTAYLARIIFDQFTENAHGEETGFGISTRLQDNEYPVVVVDDDKQRVFVIEERELQDGRIPDGYEPKESAVCRIHHARTGCSRRLSSDTPRCGQSAAA